MKIIGFCRFSFFGPSDTKLNYDDEKQAFRDLYDHKRMETRFFLFENLMLPSIAAQTDKNFELVILTSEVMPAKYRKRLLALCKPVKQIRVEFAAGMVLKEVVRPMLVKCAERGKYELVQFRIDDDDALSCHFIRRLREIASQSGPQKIISMPLGLMVYNMPEMNGIDKFLRPFTGAGFAFHSMKGRYRVIFEYAHNQAQRNFRTVTDPTNASHIQSFHASADTAMRHVRRVKSYLKNSGKSLDKEGVETMLAQEFPTIDYGCLDNVKEKMNSF